jgi:hypothetical protein
MSLANSVIRTVAIGLLVGLAAGCLVFLAYFPPYAMVEHPDLDPCWVADMKLLEFGMAMHHYASQHEGRFPPAATFDKDGRPLHSWRVLLLPFLEKDDLYKQFKLDEPWDSPHNKPLLAKMPHCYRDTRLDGPQDRTFFQVFVGPGTAFERQDLSLARDFPDGTSDTLLVVEAASYVPWTQPKDLVYDSSKPPSRLGGRFTRTVRWLGWLSRKQPIALACFADGSVRSLRNPVEEKFLRGLITRNGGETVDWDKQQ